MKPFIKSGKLVTGADCEFGDNVVIDVAEEVVLGDRCVVGDGAVFSGRRVEVGDDFYGFSWSHPQARPQPSEYAAWVGEPGELPIMRGWLDVGSGRRDEEDAVLKVGSRCTFHENRIDLARAVTIGDDVGLSPEVVIYTHGYWQSPLEGFPMRREPVTVGSGSIVGFRSVLLPGASVPRDSVVGACSVWPAGNGWHQERCVWAGTPVKLINAVMPPTRDVVAHLVNQVFGEFQASRSWRGLSLHLVRGEWPRFTYKGMGFFLDHPKVEGGSDEDEDTDDLRWHLFTRGIRLYTKRRFRKMRSER